MTKEFHRLLLSELRMAAYEPGDPEQGTDRRLCEALTVNENLASIGYTLRPDDIARLSVSESMYGFFEQLKALTPDVTAEPMYPGFPQQVLEMSEAEFRMHQMLHYFSTYGIECLTGKSVSKGWLPEPGARPRNQADDTLLERRVIELIPERDAPKAVLETLLQRRERLTNPEVTLVLESAGLCAPEQLQGLKIRFKENLDLLFPILVEEADRKTALETLRAVCSHAGDALRCGGHYLRQRRYHLRTSEKKLLVKLLESFPARNLKENLMLSDQARERNLLLLQYTDYNRFSRSAEHREAVRALRAGELISWQGAGEKLLREGNPEALRYFAGKPGYLVRMLNRLLTLGFAEEAILAVLMPAAKALSGHLLLQTVSALTKRKASLREKYRQDVLACRQRYEDEAIPPMLNLWLIETETERMRSQARRTWLELPEQEIARKAFEPMDAVKNSLREKEQELSAGRKRLVRWREAERTNNGRIRIVRNANRDWDPELTALLADTDSGRKLREDILRLETEADALRARLREMYPACEKERRRLTAEMTARNTPAFEAALRECDALEEIRREEARAAHERELAAHREAMKTLDARREAELAELEKRFREEMDRERHDQEVIRILTAVLKEHFRQADTPLKGKKVFQDLNAFDLVHSELETGNRSRDGGYIRSGICFRIPEEAKTVRFFVYWNDAARVDIDLHASGTTAEGKPLHIGWNGDFRNTGVVHSGDITHSDAAEYIDIDLSAPIREIYANIHLYDGSSAFRNVETCYVGLMAVRQAGENVRHYNPKNCFFTHTLTQNISDMKYGVIDVRNRYVRFIGQQDDWTGWDSPGEDEEGPVFSLRNYLDCLLEGQGAETVRTRQEADLVLTMGKSAAENGLSLADHNFFLES